jgi:hypothetical protein
MRSSIYQLSFERSLAPVSGAIANGKRVVHLEPRCDPSDVVPLAP